MRLVDGIVSRSKSLSSSDEKRTGRIAIPIAIVAVSFAAIFIRLSNSHPIAVAFYRMLFSTLLLLPFVPSHWEKLKELDRKQWLLLVSTGFLLALHFSAWISSLSYTSVASSVVLVTAHPLVVAWISGWYLGEKIGKKAYLGIFIALGGVVLMTFSDYRISGEALFGDILAIIGMLAVAGYLIRGREMRKELSLVTYTFTVYLFSTLFLGLISLFFRVSFRFYAPREYLLFFALALVPTIFGHTLYNWSLKYVKASLVSVSLLGEPIISSVLAFFILAETPPVLTIIGGGITLFGIYLCERFH